MNRKKRREAPERDPRQEIDGGTTAMPTPKVPSDEEELSVDPEDLGKHTLENATEAPQERR